MAQQQQAPAKPDMPTPETLPAMMSSSNSPMAIVPTTIAEVQALAPAAIEAIEAEALVPAPIRRAISRSLRTSASVSALSSIYTCACSRQ